jgi:biotin carboxylase
MNGVRVLVTYGWCRTAYAVCERLARSGFRVSACGDSALSMTRVSRYVETFDRVPDPFGSPGLYAHAIAEVIRRRNISLVIPAHEDFVPLQEFRHVLPPGVIVAGPPIDEGREVLDKWNLFRRARLAGVPTPATLAPASVEEADDALASVSLPAVLKPRRGNGAKGIVIVRDAVRGAAAYRNLVQQFQLDAGNLPLIQEYLDGVQMGCCFIAIDGEVKARFVERYVRCKQAGFGTSVLREPAASPEIENLTARLARELRWTGIGHLDFILGPDGEPYLLELNPRFWGALNLAIQNGFDFPAALASLALTGAVDLRCFVPRQPVNSLWIAGELMACLDDVQNRRWAEALRTPLRLLRCRRYDDFRLTDPLPLFMELSYYLAGFVRGGGDANPVRPAMIGNRAEHACNSSSN